MARCVVVRLKDNAIRPIVETHRQSSKGRVEWLIGSLVGLPWFRQ